MACSKRRRPRSGGRFDRRRRGARASAASAPPSPLVWARRPSASAARCRAGTSPLASAEDDDVARGGVAGFGQLRFGLLVRRRVVALGQFRQRHATAGIAGARQRHGGVEARDFVVAGERGVELAPEAGVAETIEAGERVPAQRAPGGGRLVQRVAQLGGRELAALGQRQRGLAAAWSESGSVRAPPSSARAAASPSCARASAMSSASEPPDASAACASAAPSAASPGRPMARAASAAARRTSGSSSAERRVDGGEAHGAPRAPRWPAARRGGRRRRRPARAAIRCSPRCGLVGVDGAGRRGRSRRRPTRAQARPAERSSSGDDDQPGRDPRRRASWPMTNWAPLPRRSRSPPTPRRASSASSAAAKRRRIGVAAPPGSLASAFNTSASIAGDTPAAFVDGAATSSRTCAISTASSSPANGGAPGQHLVEHGAQRVDVGPAIDVLRGHDLLGRHVGGRAQQRSGRGQVGRAGPLAQRRAADLGHAEVDDLDVRQPARLRLQEHVVGLQVAVDDAARVHGAERAADLAEDGAGLGRRQRRLPLQARRQASRRAIRSMT